MTVRRWSGSALIGAVLLCPLRGEAGQATSPNVVKVGLPPGWVEIDGAKHPELVPDHAAWQSLFGELRLLKKRGWTKDVVSLQGLPAAEEALIYSTADQQYLAHQSCDERVGRARAALSDQSPANIERFLQAETLKCREDTLGFADRLLAQLSPESQHGLLLELEQTRRRITTAMPKHDLDHWMRPR